MEWIVARWLTFIATLLIAGACAVGLLIIRRANIDDAMRRTIARESALVGIGASLLLIPASLLRLADQVMALRSPGDPLIAGLRVLLTSTMWGTGFLSQGSALLVAATGLTLAWRAPHDKWRWAIAAIGAFGLCAAPALQGHAIGSEELTALAVSADVAHVFGASLWLGTLGVIAWLGMSVPDADGIVASERAAQADARLRILVPLVPPIALPGAALLIGSGVIASVMHLRALSDLWSDEWGRYVLAKSIAACVILTLGAINWRRLGPRMALSTSSSSMRKSLITELCVALLILLITAVLVVTPLPGESDGAAGLQLEPRQLGVSRSLPAVHWMLAYLQAGT